MHVLKGLQAWISENVHHRIVLVERLPDPTFECEGRRLVSFSTNNYLGLAGCARMVQAARRGLEAFGVGNCESRILGGDLEIYRDLESRLARLKGKPAAMVFATGYLTNLGVLSALPQIHLLARFYGYRGRRHSYACFTDEFNHLSIREGIRSSGVEKITYRHCDMNDLESRLRTSKADVKIIVSDGVFSQDGDIVPLPQVVELAERYDTLVYIDDAHGTGILGPNGGGTTEHFGIQSERIICMGTLSKAYGAIGGFIATEPYMIDMLRLGCSAYGFTSTLPPDQAMAVAEAMKIVADEPWRREKLWANQRYFAERIGSLGYRVLSRATPIIPVWIGDEGICERMSFLLGERGFHVDAICFPAVAKGQARLRFIMNANHTKEQIDALLAAMVDLHDMTHSGRSSPAASGSNGQHMGPRSIEQVSVTVSKPASPIATKASGRH